MANDPFVALGEFAQKIVERLGSNRIAAITFREREEDMNTMNAEPKLTLDEAKAVVATKTHPRVTEDSIKEKIASVVYTAPTQFSTLCVITMKNGWISTGFSAPADERNFDWEVGKRYAYENAFKPLWQLEGYLLRELLSKPIVMVERGDAKCHE